MDIIMERESDEEGDESAEDGGGDGDGAELRSHRLAARCSPARAARFAVPPHPIFRTTSSQHYLASSQHYLVAAMSQLVQRCSPTTGRMPRSILGLTAGALSGWAVWRISSMRTHTTL